MRCILKPVALALFFTASANAADKPRKFWTDPTIVTITINGIIIGSDIASTRRALRIPGTYEANPLIRNQGVAIAMKAAFFGTSIGAAYLLHKSGHEKAARIVPALFAVPSGWAAIHNARLK